MGDARGSWYVEFEAEGTTRNHHSALLLLCLPRSLTYRSARECPHQLRGEKGHICRPESEPTNRHRGLYGVPANQNATCSPTAPAPGPGIDRGGFALLLRRRGGRVNYFPFQGIRMGMDQRRERLQILLSALPGYGVSTVKCQSRCPGALISKSDPPKVANH
jgi:hypothetical protein